MQTKKLNPGKISLIVLLSVILFSFTRPAGGEGFEIFLNSKVVAQRFGNQQQSLQTLYLGQNSAKDQLTVKYYHCGKMGKYRTISLKNDQNKTIKEWHFADNKSSAAMTMDVKDILLIQKNRGNQKLSLHYTSSELPGGRMLIYVAKANLNVARLWH